MIIILKFGISIYYNNFNIFNIFIYVSSGLIAYEIYLYIMHIYKYFPNPGIYPLKQLLICHRILGVYDNTSDHDVFLNQYLIDLGDRSINQLIFINYKVS